MLIREYLSNKLFLLGLLIRLALIISVVPIIHMEWFIPFLQNTIMHPSVNPWETFIQYHSASFQSFPYGIMMLTPLLFGLLLGKFVTANIGVTIIIFVLDFATLEILNRITDYAENNKMIIFYWLSPIVIYINYWHGQLDIIPVFFLMLSLLLLKNRRVYLSALVMAAAISAKISMLIIVPVILIYLYKTKKVKAYFYPYLLALIFGLAIFIGPWLLNQTYVNMTLNNPQAQKIGLITLNFGNGLQIYLLPIIYILYLYIVWYTERMSFQLLYAFIGVAFALLLIFTPASIGWYLWLMPFMILYLAKNKSKIENLVFLAASICFVIFALFFQKGCYILGFKIDYLAPKFLLNNYIQLQSYMLTLMAILIALLSYQMCKKGIRNSIYYKISRNPISIGIAGDSGSGKDTLAAALCGLFNQKSTASISGDDYHKWDRYDPMWKLMTHLDPRANNLYQFSNDVISLIQGQKILTRHYDHNTGRFSHEFSVDKNDFIIVSGLHVLYLNILQENLNVKVFLDMDEKLRLFLKMQRDIMERGRSKSQVLESIARRENDKTKFITPQKTNADIIFSLLSLEEFDFAQVEKDGKITTPSMYLKITLQTGFNHDELLRFLIANCLCFAEAHINTDGHIDITVIGDLFANDIKLGADLLAPELLELLDFAPIWAEGMLGLMQLVVLMQASHNLKKRLA